MKATLLAAALLALACGYHDTSVATYRPPIQVDTGGYAAGGAPSGGEATGGSPEAGAPVELTCPETYTALVDGVSSRYKLVAPGAPWVVAERDCEADGAHLIVIDSAAEQTYLTSLATQTTTDSASTNQLVWLGLSDQAVEGTFEWVTGATLSLTHWSSGEPNSAYGGIEDCAEIRSTGAWNDDHCSARLAYVCECDGTRSAARWCDTDAPSSCGDCSTSCTDAQSCVAQKCE